MRPPASLMAYCLLWHRLRARSDRRSKHSKDLEDGEELKAWGGGVAPASCERRRLRMRPRAWLDVKSSYRRATCLPPRQGAGACTSTRRLTSPARPQWDPEVAREAGFCPRRLCPTGSHRAVCSPSVERLACAKSRDSTVLAMSPSAISPLAGEGASPLSASPRLVWGPLVVWRAASWSSTAEAFKGPVP